MLRELLRRLIDRQPDMEVVGEELDPLRLLLAVGERDAEVVVLTQPPAGGDPGLCSHLLSEYPRLVVLGLSPHGERAVLYRLQMTREELAERTDDHLLAALRRATARVVDCNPGTTGDEGPPAER